LVGRACTIDGRVFHLHRRSDGAVIVRVPSTTTLTDLPPAAFTFRPGDPQYELWDARLREGEQSG